MKITRTLAVAAAAVAAVALSACEAPESAKAGSSSGTATATAAQRTVEPASAPTETYEAPTLDEIAERAFLNTVSDYQSPSDEASLMVGRATCTLLDGGSTPETLSYELMLADGPVVPGFSNDELPFFYGAAMGSLCPEYGERFFG